MAELVSRVSPCLNFDLVHFNLIPRPFEGEEKGPGTYCMRMHQLPQGNLEYCKLYVTGFGKTLRMGFFQKIEFDAWLISSSMELTLVQVLGR